jgi:hypothetical protein
MLLIGKILYSPIYSENLQYFGTRRELEVIVSEVLPTSFFFFLNMFLCVTHKKLTLPTLEFHIYKESFMEERQNLVFIWEMLNVV